MKESLLILVLLVVFTMNAFSSKLLGDDGIGAPATAQIAEKH